MSSTLSSSKMDQAGSGWMRIKDGSYMGAQEAKAMEFRGKEITKQADLEKSERLVMMNLVEEGLDRKVTNWRSLFTTFSDQSINYFPPQQLNGKTVVSPLKEVYEQGEEL